jgi:hypothetical protein
MSHAAPSPPSTARRRPVPPATEPPGTQSPRALSARVEYVPPDAAVSARASSAGADADKADVDREVRLAPPCVALSSYRPPLFRTPGP